MEREREREGVRERGREGERKREALPLAVALCKCYIAGPELAPSNVPLNTAGPLATPTSAVDFGVGFPRRGKDKQV